MKKKIYLKFILLFLGLNFTELIIAQTEEKIIIKKEMKKDVEGAWLGVMLKQIDDDKVEVEKVIENSPAEKSGIEKGDIFVSIDGKVIQSSKNVVDAVSGKKPKSKIKIIVLRNNSKKEIEAELGVSDLKEKTISITTDMFENEMPMMHGFQLFNDKPKYEIGLEVETLNKQLAEYFEVPDKKGVIVKSVVEDSPASKSGFKAGDIIIKIGNDRIKNVNDVIEILDDSKNGESLSFEVLRKGVSKKLQVALNKTSDEDGECECAKNKRNIIKGFKLNHFPKNFNWEAEPHMKKIPRGDSQSKEIKVEVMEL